MFTFLTNLSTSLSGILVIYSVKIITASGVYSINNHFFQNSFINCPDHIFDASSRDSSNQNYWNYEDNQMQDLHLEVLRQLEKLRKTESSKSRIEWFKQQHKGTKLESLGIKTSKVRKLIRSFTKQFMELNLEEKFKLAIKFYDTGVFEQATIGDSLLELSGQNLTPKHYDSFDAVVSRFDRAGYVSR